MIGREIAAGIRADWSGAREELVWAGVGPRRRRRAAARIALASTLVVALAGIALLAWPRERTVGEAPPPAAPAVAAPASATPPFGLAVDGEVREIAATPERVTFELVRGEGRFESEHVIEVHSGSVTVEGLHAVFAASRSDGATHVVVFRGDVLVRAGNQQRRLRAGEQGDFGEPPAAPPATAPPPAKVAPRGPSRWRELAREGEYERAYGAYDHSDGRTEDLLMVADVMRLSHHPAEAVAPLREIVHDHPDDPRAPLAAFTLGRVLLEELGTPREAADAFSDAARLAPDGPLAEDAIAREVEALSRAGDAVAARHVAEDYLLRFSDGRKVRSVRKFGGLE